MTAFDDQTSTFIIPSGAGFEVVFCPGARSTNIIDTSLEQMQQLSQRGVDKQTALVMKQRRQAMFARSAGVKASRSDECVVMAVLIWTVLFSAFM